MTEVTTERPGTNEQAGIKQVNVRLPALLIDCLKFVASARGESLQSLIGREMLVAVEREASFAADYTAEVASKLHHKSKVFELVATGLTLDEAESRVGPVDI